MMNRRDFIKTTLLAGAAVSLAPSILLSAAKRSKSYEIPGKLLSDKPFDLDKYYGGSGIERSKRYLDVKNWYQDNNKRLLEDFSADLDNNLLAYSGKGLKESESVRQFTIYAWFGVQYAADNYLDSSARRIPVAAVESGDLNCGFSLKEGTVYATTALVDKVSELSDNDSRIVAAFNFGIHECAHAMPWANGQGAGLGEIGVYFVQNKLALPLHYQLTNDEELLVAQIAMGVRGLNQLSNVHMMSEYLAMLIGPYLKAWHEKKGAEPDALDYVSPYEEPHLFHVYSDIKKYGSASAEDYCRMMGIDDSRISGKLQAVFGQLGRKYKAGEFTDFKHTGGLRSMEEALVGIAFLNAMAEEFGEAHDDKLPSEYVLASPRKMFGSPLLG